MKSEPQWKHDLLTKSVGIYKFNVVATDTIVYNLSLKLIFVHYYKINYVGS